MPAEWLLSRILEEGLARDLESAGEVPIEMALRVMEYRGYAAAKRVIDQAKQMGDVEMTPMAELVMDVRAELFKRRKAAKAAKAQQGG